MVSAEILTWLAGREDKCPPVGTGPNMTCTTCGGSGKVARYRLLWEACRCWCHDEWKEPFIGHLSDCPKDGTSHQVIIPLDDAALAVVMRQLREKKIEYVVGFNSAPYIRPGTWALVGPLDTRELAEGLSVEIDALLAAWYAYESQ